MSLWSIFHRQMCVRESVKCKTGQGYVVWVGVASLSPPFSQPVAEAAAAASHGDGSPLVSPLCLGVGALVLYTPSPLYHPSSFSSSHRAIDPWLDPPFPFSPHPHP